MPNFSGIAPVLKCNGQAAIVHRRYARPLYVRPSFNEYGNEGGKARGHV